MARPKSRGNGQGSTYFDRHQGRWRAAVTLPDGRRKTRVTGTRRQAEQALAGLRAEAGEPIVPTTVHEAAIRFLEACQARNLAPRTVELYEERLRLHVLPRLGHLRLDRLTPQHVDQLYAALLRERGLSARTVLSVHGVLHGVLRFAERRRLVARNVAVLVDPPRVERYHARTLTVDEARRLLEAIRGHLHGPLWAFLLATGCRFGEAAGLAWAAVDLEAGLAEVRQTAVRVRREQGWTVVLRSAPKTPAGWRTLPLARWIVRILREQRVQVAERQLATAGWQDHDLVFPGAHGAALRESYVLRSWKRLLAGAGLPAIRMHDLRHTLGTALADSGEETLVIQRLLGHASVGVTAGIYVGRVPGAVRRAAERWGERLAPD